MLTVRSVFSLLFSLFSSFMIKHYLGMEHLFSIFTGHGLASDANDADDDCTPSATGNNSETGTATAAATAAAARAIAIEANEGDAAGVTKPGASKPPSITTGKASTRGGKGGRAGNSSSSSSTRGKRAGGAAGTKRKVPSASAGSAADAASGSTGSVPKTNAKTKKSVKAAGPRPAQPVSSNFCFFDEPIEELVEPAAGAKDGAGDEDGDGEVAGGVVNVKAEVDDDNDAVDNGGGGADGGDANEEDTNVVNDDGDDDYDDDDALQKESPGRKKVKLEAGNAANEDGDEMAGVVASV